MPKGKIGLRKPPALEAMNTCSQLCFYPGHVSFLVSKPPSPDPARLQQPGAAPAKTPDLTSAESEENQISRKQMFSVAVTWRFVCTVGSLPTADGTGISVQEVGGGYRYQNVRSCPIVIIPCLQLREQRRLCQLAWQDFNSDNCFPPLSVSLAAPRGRGSPRVFQADLQLSLCIRETKHDPVLSAPVFWAAAAKTNFLPEVELLPCTQKLSSGSRD